MKWILFFSMILGSASSVWAGPDDLAYFKQFLYHKEEIGNDPDFPEYSFHFLATTFGEKKKMLDGRYLGVKDDIFLFEDGTFKIRHSEIVFETIDANTFLPMGCKMKTGRWSVPDTKLILEGVGTAERAMVNERYGVRITFSENILTPELKGQSFDAGAVISGSGDPLQWPCW